MGPYFGFWKKLKKPVMVLAPMADVTDAAFRCIIAKYGKPDVMWTEFVSADGLFLADKRGKEKLMKDLVFSAKERPIVAQFFTAHPEMMERAARLAVELGFDGVDINMGCPDRSIEKQGAGAALMKHPLLARELIAAAKRGAESSGKTIPVSVKTRIGYGKDELDTWLPELLKESPAVITIHARTRKEMSGVPARWDTIARAVALRDRVGSKTLIIGNGDARDITHARRLAKETGCDGVMLGRAIFGNPFLFSSAPKKKNFEENISKKLHIMLEHTRLFEKLLPHKNFSVMKKHYKAYVNGFEGARELRVKLMETKCAADAEKVVNDFLKYDARRRVDKLVR